MRGLKIQRAVIDSNTGVLSQPGINDQSLGRQIIQG